MPSESQHKVTVVIPTWRRGDLLRRCLDSLQSQSLTDFEVIVVENGAGEWARQLVRELDFKRIRFDENRGFAAAVNAGIAVSRSAYIAILNDDVELSPDWLALLTALLDRRPDLAFCCGKIFRPDGKTIDNAGDALSLGGAAWRLGYGRPDGPEFDQARPLHAISGTASLFRRSVFERVGTFDEDFVSYLEDVDLSIRLWRADLHGWYLPQAVASHHGGASTETVDGEQPPFVFEQLTRNQLALLAKHYPFRLVLRLAPRIVWAQVLWATMALRQGRIGAYLRGVFRFVAALPSMLLKRRAWTGKQRREFLALLRVSDADIYEDIVCGPPQHRDTYWGLYFGVFRPPVVFKGNVAENASRAASKIPGPEKAGSSLGSG